MSLSRYEHAEIVKKIDGHMISRRYGETGEQYFMRAKSQLLSNLHSQIEKVSSFSYEDFCKKDKRMTNE